MQSPIPIGNPPITQDWLGIWYSPLIGEAVPSAGKLKSWKVLPSDKDMDPFALAKSIKQEIPRDARVYLFIPGTRFDRFGTRVGRGGGWYDRFLSAVPRAWLRVGVIGTGQLSEQPLERQTWDEPMDWLVMA